MADIITITLVVPVFSGLWASVSTTGCLMGMFSGLATVMVWGWAEFGTFIAGPEMITMMCFGNTDQVLETYATGHEYPKCGFYANRAPLSFPTIVCVTFVVTLGVSWMDRVYALLQACALPQSPKQGGDGNSNNLSRALPQLPVRLNMEGQEGLGSTTL